MHDRDEVTIDTVLAPVDGSDESATAVRYAVAIADRYGASVHSLYVLDRGVVDAMDAGSVEANTIAETSKGFFDEVREITTAAGVPLTTAIDAGFSTTRKLIHPGNVVLDTAEEIDADFIVLPREPGTDGGADVLERAAEYVLSYASQPVLSV